MNDFLKLFIMGLIIFITGLLLEKGNQRWQVYRLEQRN